MSPAALPTGLPARASTGPLPWLRAGWFRAVVALALATVLAGSLVPAASAQPATTDPAEAGAGWLARQLVDGERLQVAFGDDVFDDHGATVDAVLGLAAAGVSDDAAARATAWMEQPGNTETYVGDGTTSVWAGPTAKLALLAQVRGLDPTSWGDDGVDLIDRLLDREQPNGRFTDVNPWPPNDDFSNAIGQSLAIIALHRQPGVAPSEAAIDLLLESQCADGGFALELEVDPTDCTPSADVTAFAVQALLAVGRSAEAEAGLDFLVATQLPDGSWGTPGPEGPNANTTGLGGQALAAGGRDDAAGRAAGYVLSVQAGCDAPEDDRGAIAYDETGLDDRAPRATAQGVLALAPISFAELTAAAATREAPVLACEVVAEPVLEPVDTAPPAREAPREVPAAPAGAAPAAAVTAQPSFTG